ncbi:MAG: stage II sporulation protein E (SpoIIE) [Gemmatimonadetes bacterium]|nr:MAG: stage II sporulation protein E (SpoIIE) [Gemmatimonadota bacterium]
MAARDLKIDAAFATLPLPGESESGDLCLIKRVGKGTLIAVVDGLGHGQEAASAAHAAVAALDRYAREPLIELVRRSHDALTGLRGVVLGLAYLDPHAATMAWLGVGNVGGVLLRADVGNRPSRITLVPNAGFIGAEQAHPTTRSVPLALGDTVILYSDGIKDGFAESLALSNSPQEIADFVIARHVKGNDDALVLVARYVR